jgi:hypothetical protein
MPLNNPTLDDLKEQRAGLTFNDRTRPTAARAQTILDEAVQTANAVLRQIGLTPEEIDDIDPVENPELQTWFNRFVLNEAMANVWSVLPGLNGNPYQDKSNELRERALRQPESVGVPLPEDWSSKPKGGTRTDLPFSGRYSPYLRSTGGF